MNKKFEHEGKTFEIRGAIIADRYVVRVFDGNKIVLEGSATLKDGQDFFACNQRHIFDQLAEEAEREVRAGRAGLSD